MRPFPSRRMLGLGAVVVVSVILGFLKPGPSPTQLVLDDQHILISMGWEFLYPFAAFALGGYVARNRFMPVAISFAILGWVFVLYILYRIALPTGQADILSIATGNVSSLLSIVAMAALGTFVGEQLFRFKHKLPSVN